MSRPVGKSLVLVVSIFTAVFGALSGLEKSQAQTENLDVRDPRLREGQMFVVKLIPAGRKLEVLITGKQAAEVDFGQLGLQATLFVGNKAITLAPKRDRDRFILDAAASKSSRLKLEVKEGRKTEQFEFERLP